ncbi:hypothetical protein [Rubrivivax gelatinosus]|uniref:hypothetical protein n=1 Tax=Rubrivivax gelatinosus TaxID=28068 RepID=UPI0005C1AF09|nr:hypothetical protein [Rubrivivax gelatinosus]MBG6083128.1 hypothetical protein [Rubrivivax gelatinosus]
MAKMTNEDRATIRRFAGGDKTVRGEAERIYKACVGDQPNEPEMLFMSEVTNPAPDLLLRAQYRQRLRNAAA